MAYFRCMRPKAGFSRKAFTAYIAMERSVFRPFHLSVVIPKVLLEIGKLYEGSTAVRKVTFVWTFSWKLTKQSVRNWNY